MCVSVLQRVQEEACDRARPPDSLNGNLCLSSPEVRENQHVTFIPENGFYKPFYFPFIKGSLRNEKKRRRSVKVRFAVIIHL